MVSNADKYVLLPGQLKERCKCGSSHIELIQTGAKGDIYKCHSCGAEF